MESVITYDSVETEFCKADTDMLHLDMEEMQDCSVFETNWSLVNITGEVLAQAKKNTSISLPLGLDATFKRQVVCVVSKLCTIDV